MIWLKCTYPYLLRRWTIILDLPRSAKSPFWRVPSISERSSVCPYSSRSANYLDAFHHVRPTSTARVVSCQQEFNKMFTWEHVELKLNKGFYGSFRSSWEDIASHSVIFHTVSSISIKVGHKCWNTKSTSFFLQHLFSILFSNICTLCNFKMSIDLLDRFWCPLIGSPPPVVSLEAEGVGDTRESVERHHEDEEVGVILGLHARALGAAGLWNEHNRGSIKIYQSNDIYDWNCSACIYTTISL